jgi:hypothetical protein
MAGWIYFVHYTNREEYFIIMHFQHFTKPASPLKHKAPLSCLSLYF